MGHTRLGELPKTRKWKTVVAGLVGQPLGGGDTGIATLAADDVDRLSRLALDAAKSVLDRIAKDPALRHAVYLLTQVVLAAREANWEERLRKVGIHLSPQADSWELAGEMQREIDQRTRSAKGSPDIGELVQQAASEAMSGLAYEKTHSLFQSGRDELLSALRDLSTKAGFATLGQRFFGRFMARFLNFYLSRATAAQVGRERLPSIHEVRRFEEQLDLHCQQSARIVHDYCGDWYSKTNFEGGITPAKTNAFLSVAMKKLRREMEKQEVSS